MNNHQAWLNPIRIAARRGNLEAELLLNAYIDKVLSQQHNPALIADFKQLLEQDDQTLFDWLMHPDDCPTDFQPLVSHIRQTYLTP
ncbi:MAG: succinate dehydrogenase assembly factor 2 [Thiomicrospira sp.]|uniref:FAD assembly factor SdhE n=1 Tax=Thiomicrospira sp. TaxID=935 RepID=UPI0019FDA5CB|nr:succinate dehydrogenase assembly factor 2 [Thiomicrospira sp.]MBE0493265.1 succinate dehydrogenase assembly factor 2 [Thiomicrospira sp.]